MNMRACVIPILAITVVLIHGCSKPESPKEPASKSSPEPQAAAPALQASAPQEGAPPEAVPASDKVYVCDMGCEVVDHPGKCSMCGMTLKEVDRADISYVCGACGFASDKPGACPKDHTILVLNIKDKKA